MTLRDWLIKEQFTLSLSSGFFGFYAHLGVVKALEDNGIFASKYTGASAGAIIAAAKAAGCTVQQIENKLIEVKREDFWDPTWGLGYLKGQKFADLLSDIIPNNFEQLKQPCEIVTFDLRKFATKTITQGDLIQAVRASGTIPLAFHPVRWEKTFLFDGGVLHKSAIPQQTPERVLCHYLFDPKSLWARAEWKRDHARLQPDHKILKISNLPQVHPFQLSRGKSAIDRAYEATVQALQQPAELSVLRL